MKFKYSAFIENTPEMREWLESIGYKLVDERNDFPFIQTNPVGFKHDNGTYRTCYYNGNTNLSEAGYINCLGNPSLFKAVTAVRDDSDKGKYFIDSEGRFVECQREMIKEFIDRAFITGYDISDLREATLEELIEHFKK